MLETYKATLRGNRIEGSDETPQNLTEDAETEVFVTIVSKESAAKNLRPFGLSAGEFVVPKDFDAPLSEEVLATFEN